MAILVGDVIFTREGRPVQVTSRDKQSGEVTLERDFDKVRETNIKGIKNGLEPKEKEAFRAVLSEVQDSDKKAEIEKLIQQVAELKKSNADPRLIRYLESELHFKMSRERYTPDTYAVNYITLTSY